VAAAAVPQTAEDVFVEEQIYSEDNTLDRITTV
jgi:hypothetical protein